MRQNEVVIQPILYITQEKGPLFKTAETDLEDNIFKS